MSRPRLVLAAHGSTDPGYPAVIEAIGSSVVAELRRRGIDDTVVFGGYLDHNEPRLRDVAGPGDIVVPLLLSTGYHATADIPQAASRAVVAAPLGPDRRLAAVCAQRLLATGWLPTGSVVVLAAAGSSDPAAADDVSAMAGMVADEIGAPVTAAYLSAGAPSLADVMSSDEVARRGATIVPYLLAPGRFADLTRGCGADLVADVIGADPVVAAIAVDRYLATPRR